MGGLSDGDAGLYERMVKVESSVEVLETSVKTLVLFQQQVNQLIWMFKGVLWTVALVWALLLVLLGAFLSERVL